MTRSLADERRFDNAGKEIADKVISCKDGANPPKNPAGRSGTCSPAERMLRCVSRGNGFCINMVNFPNSKSVKWSSSWPIRSACSSAIMIFSASSSEVWKKGEE